MIFCCLWRRSNAISTGRIEAHNRTALWTWRCSTLSSWPRIPSALSLSPGWVFYAKTSHRNYSRYSSDIVLFCSQFSSSCVADLHTTYWRPGASDTVVIMVALCNRADHYIFILFLSSFFFFFSSPNLSGRRLDVYHTLAHGVALVRI